MQNKLLNWAAPLNSRRRFMAKLVVKSLIYPKRVARQLNGRNFKILVASLTTDGLVKTVKKSKLYINNFFLTTSIAYAPVQLFKQTRFDEISFPDEANPLVSIIIPVFNQWFYTYNCLLSIWTNTPDVSYEIIIVDDFSTDETVNILKTIKNIRLIRNPENKGFLLNCNQAAELAKGQFILFLNNDTNVQENWLGALVEMMGMDQTIGMAGSKLVYPDGRLQEAGGIIWRDASGCNYGCLDDPNKPEYNYQKEVDYISGASIMIRTSLWKQIGGFDTQYAPAYYEDTDLAFEVRKSGYKVVYQPKSVVVHYEGISNGKDLSAGVKRCQVKNQEKFLEKWRDVLNREHFDNGVDLFLARDRSRGKRTVLVVDHYIPRFDQDAGSRSTFAYIKIFLDNGFNVKFLGDDYFPHQPYTAIFESMGIEVLYGTWYKDHYAQWIRENGVYFDFAFLSRPHVAIKYIDLLKSAGKMKLVYFGHDLHYLRDMREYQLTGDQEYLASSKKWQKIEDNIFHKADVVYYPSQIEIDLIKEKYPNINAKAVPVYVYENVPVLENIDFSQRSGLLFVGGFSHRPNVDGILWFAENIFPAVLRGISGLKLYIVGSNPPERIRQLQSDNIEVTGFIPDAELKTYYARCRMVVAPLRFGAGVKGKIIEAMYNQMPVVTTAIGAEGMVNLDDTLIIAGNDQEFIAAIVQCYPDIERLSALSRQSYAYVKRYYSREYAEAVIREDLLLG